MMGSRSFFTAGAVLFAVLALPPGLKARTLGEEVNEAVERGVGWVREYLKTEGCFGAGGLEPFRDGVAALSLLALVKSGVPPGDPGVRKCLSLLRYKPYTRTYCAGLRILALDALGAKEGRDHSEEIRKAASWLLSNFNKNSHWWGYPMSPPGSAAPFHHQGDLSNTQYAVLGLWTAERHGFTTPPEIWEKLAKKVLTLQEECGGIKYADDSPIREISGSMTGAGILVLALAEERLPKKSKTRLGLQIRVAVERAWKYIDERFHPDRTPVGAHAYFPFNLYYIYGLERACAICGRRELGGKKWYPEVAKEILRKQTPQGNWGGLVDTCFALLVLRLSTYTSMGIAKPTADGSLPGGRSRKKKPARTVPFVRQWLILGPFDDDGGETGMARNLIGERTVDAREGTRHRGKKWILRRSAMPYFDLARLFPGKEHSLAYAFTRLRVECDVDAILWFDSADGARIWLDGDLMYDRNVRFFYSGNPCGKVRPDGQRLPVRLSAGTHRLLIKVANFVDEWGFYLRLCRKDGSPIEGLKTSTDPAGPTSFEKLDMLPPPGDLETVSANLPADRRPKCGFGSERDVERVFLSGNMALENYCWADLPGEVKGPRPPSGRTGFLYVQPAAPGHPVRIYRKVRLSRRRFTIKARVAACDPDSLEKGDWIARLGVFDGAVTWYGKKKIAAGAKKKPAGWIDITAEVRDNHSREVLIVLECSIGKDTPSAEWCNKRVFVDELSVR